MNDSCQLKEFSQCESCEFSFIWGLMKTLAQETEGSREQRRRGWGGRGQCTCDFGEGGYMQSSTDFGRSSMLATKSRCLH